MNSEADRDAQLLNLLELALNLPDDAREAAIREACKDDALGSEVLNLLADDDSQGDFLTKPMEVIQRVQLGAALADPAPPVPDLTGRTIDRFIVTSKLGEGGMGAVYRATQTDPIEREVALKVMSRGLLDPDERDHFARETQAMARMNHPNIGQIFDAGTTEDGFLYFVMELIEGEPITRFCDQRRLSIAERLKLFRAICMAVNHAHQKRILHLDIKPSNVLIADIQGEAFPKVIDFGIAVSLDASAKENPGAESSVTAGTPSYASPEMMNPVLAMEDLDIRADIYSLGILLYELLVGERPQQFRQRSVSEVFNAMKEQAIRAPSEHFEERAEKDARAIANVRRTRPSGLAGTLRGDLDAVALKATQFDRDARYSTASELAMDIRSYTQQRPVIAQPWTRSYLVSRFVQRNRLPVAAALAVGIVLVTGIISITQSLHQARQAAREAAATVDFLETVLEINNPYEAMEQIFEAPADYTIKELLDLGGHRALDSLQDQPAIQARVLHSIGNSLRSYPDPVAPVPLLERAVELRNKLYGPNHEFTVNSRLALGWAYERLGRYAEAEVLFRQALNGAETGLEPDAPELLQAKVSLAKIRFTQFRNPEATMELEAALAAATQSDTSFLLIGDLLNTLAWDAYVKKQHERSVDFMSRALALYEDHFEPIHPSIALFKSNLAAMSIPAGRIQEAEALATSAISIYQKTIQPDHWRIANSNAVLGAVRINQGRYPEAELLLLDALARVIEGTGERTVYTRSILEDLEVLYQRWEKPEQAAEMTRRLEALR